MLSILKGIFVLVTAIGAAVFVNIKVYEYTRNWIYGFIAAVATFFILGSIIRNAAF